MVRHPTGQRHGRLAGARVVPPADVQEQVAPRGTVAVVAQPRHGHELGHAILGQKMVGQRRELAAQTIVRARAPVREGTQPLPAADREVEETCCVVERLAPDRRVSVEQRTRPASHHVQQVRHRSALRETNLALEYATPWVRQLQLYPPVDLRPCLLDSGGAIDEGSQSVEPVPFKTTELPAGLQILAPSVREIPGKDRAQRPVLDLSDLARNLYARLVRLRLESVRAAPVEVSVDSLESEILQVLYEPRASRFLRHARHSILRSEAWSARTTPLRLLLHCALLPSCLEQPTLPAFRSALRDAAPNPSRL